MLPGVNYQREKLVFAPQHLAMNRGDLHKVRTSADDVQNFQHFGKLL
jgi:hypothetical protein